MSEALAKRSFVLGGRQIIFLIYSRTCLALEQFKETNRRRYTGQKPGTKSASRPVIDRLSTAVQPPFKCEFRSSFGLHRIFFVPASRGTPRKIFYHCLEKETFFIFWANTPVVCVLCCPSPPGPAVPPCAAPYRFARGISGFWIRQVVNSERMRKLRTCSSSFTPTRCTARNKSKDLSNPKYGHTTGRSGRGGTRRDGEEGRG